MYRILTPYQALYLINRGRGNDIVPFQEPALMGIGTDQHSLIHRTANSAVPCPPMLPHPSERHRR